MGEQTWRWMRRAGWALLALLVVWVVAWLAVPPIAKSQIEKIASERLGRQVTVGRIDFKPWTLELTVDDLVIAGPAGSAVPQLSVARIYIDGELQSLLRLAPVIDAIQVESPKVAVRHKGDGQYDFDDVLQRLAAAGEPEKADAEPARFALYNVSVTGGAVQFVDDAVGKTHELTDLSLAVPFLSNLPSQREVKVQPHLAFVLNGSRFDSAAEATPFAQTRQGQATLKLDGLDLARYVGYLPASVPVRLQAGVLGANVQIAFEQSPEVAVRLSGDVRLDGLKLADRQGGPVLTLAGLRVAMDSVRPLAQDVALRNVSLDGLNVDVRRDAAGRINLMQLAEPSPAGKVAVNAPTPAASAPVAVAPRAGWRLKLAHLELKNSAVAWQDATPKPAAALTLSQLAFDAENLAWPVAQPVPFHGDGKLADSSFSFKGEAAPDAAKVQAEFDGVPLKIAAPYVNQFLEPGLAGSLAGKVELDWSPSGLRVNAPSLALSDAVLSQGKASLASIKRLEIADAKVDLTAQTASAGRVGIVNPKASMERDAEGKWMFERWTRSAGGTSQAQAAPAAKVSVPGKTWRVSLGELSVDGGAVSYADRAQGRPVLLEVSALNLKARDIAPDSSKPSAVNVSARMSTPRGGEAGRLAFRGTVAAQPVAVQGRLDATSIPAHAFASYVQQFLNVQLLRADVSFRGDVRYAQTARGPLVKVRGDTSLEDLRANTARGAAADRPAAAGFSISEELLSWKALALRGLDVNMSPGTATTVDVRETTLADFFARVTINENGRINLQDLVRHDDAQTADVDAKREAGAEAAKPAEASAAKPATATAAADDPLAPVIRFGPIGLINGKVLFTDHFVKPNYSADLSELNGKLGAFSSVAPQGAPLMADLELRGRAEGTASLDISGKLNPLAKPIALDIQAKVRDLELPPLSPYSVKYAGHGIERGKLSVDVAYRVQPDGQLTASNKLILNQLTFGEPVPGAPTSLPVKLAVALLADRNGVIDIDLPISGSLNDPKFSLGPVIFKVIVNLIVKAITSPFSLLSGAFGGGGDELSAVPFALGTNQIASDAQPMLDKVAKALIDRPALRVTVIGATNAQTEGDAFRRDRLQQLVLAEKRRVAALSSGSAGAAAVKAVTPQEYPELLKAVYRRADMPKPRNLIGMIKDVPVQEMESLLLANIPATDDMLRELAVQRAVVVKDYLASKQVPVDRLFLGAPKTGAPKPGAELNLTAK